MVRFSPLSNYAVASLLVGIASAAVTLNISSTPGHNIPNGLWGYSFEDTNHGGDGGLYAELLQNRAFQKVTPGTPEALFNWKVVNGAGMAVIADPIPVSTALPNSLQVTIPTGKFGAVGVANFGYYGLRLTVGSQYRASFSYRFPTASSFRGTITVGLTSSTGLFMGVANVTANGNITTWVQASVTITPQQAALNNNNLFSLTLDGQAAQGLVVHFAMASLMPGPVGSSIYRTDLLAAINTGLAVTKGYYRIPGGRNFAGTNLNTRWRWRDTVGPLLTRPGRVGTEGYVNTDGLGLLEHLLLAESTSMHTIMSVWDGLPIEGDAVPIQDLMPIIQEAVDQINFAIGPINSSPAATLRGTLGHASPFALLYVEIGHEDTRSPSTYPDRWGFMISVLSQTFPQLRFVATTNPNNPVLEPGPTHYDIHTYDTPSWFRLNTHYYDNFERDGALYFQGEYGAVFAETSVASAGLSKRHDRLMYPTVESALAEAAFMTGIERNSDIVRGACYGGSLFNNIAGTTQTPSLISFNLERVIFSTSYHVIMMQDRSRLFPSAVYTYMPTTAVPADIPDFYWSISRSTPGAPGPTAESEIRAKLINTSSTTSQVVTINLAAACLTYTSFLLTGASQTSNNPTTPTAVGITAGVSGSVTGFRTQVITVAPNTFMIVSFARCTGNA